jgi:hypothetical protein
MLHADESTYLGSVRYFAWQSHRPQRRFKHHQVYHLAFSQRLYYEHVSRNGFGHRGLYDIKTLPYTQTRVIVLPSGPVDASSYLT